MDGRWARHRGDLWVHQRAIEPVTLKKGRIAGVWVAHSTFVLYAILDTSPFHSLSLQCTRARQPIAQRLTDASRTLQSADTLHAGVGIAPGVASGMVHNIRLEDLAAQIPVISEPKAASYIESCKVCFDIHYHRSGVSMSVNYTKDRHKVGVWWDGEVTERNRRACADATKRVDEGTCAIALLLLMQFANLVAVEVSQKRNGIDYYLANSNDADFDDDHLIFNRTAVLEVSGIQTQRGSNTIASRIKTKQDRLVKYSTSTTSQTVDLPTYICVVEFSEPEAQVALE